MLFSRGPRGTAPGRRSSASHVKLRDAATKASPRLSWLSHTPRLSWQYYTPVPHSRPSQGKLVSAMAATMAWLRVGHHAPASSGPAGLGPHSSPTRAPPARPRTARLPARRPPGTPRSSRGTPRSSRGTRVPPEERGVARPAGEPTVNREGRTAVTQHDKRQDERGSTKRQAGFAAGEPWAWAPGPRPTVLKREKLLEPKWLQCVRVCVFSFCARQVHGGHMNVRPQRFPR